MGNYCSVGSVLGQKAVKQLPMPKPHNNSASEQQTLRYQQSWSRHDEKQIKISTSEMDFIKNK